MTIGIKALSIPTFSIKKLKNATSNIMTLGITTNGIMLSVAYAERRGAHSAL